MRPAWTHNLFLANVYRFFLISAAGFILLYGAGFVVPFKGPWADFAASKFLSGRIDLPTHLEKVEVFRWSQVSFRTMALDTKNGYPFLVAGPGMIDVGQSRSGLIDLENLRLAEAFHPASLFTSWPIAKGLEGEFLLSRLRVRLSGNRSRGLIRFLQCESDDFSLRGGLVLKDRRITKMHIYLSLASSRLKKIPPQIRSRMSEQRRGWAAVHIVFYQNQLTFVGRHGPLFQAKWQGQGLGILG